MNPGEIIQKRYRIERVLGQGSMGMTYKALDLTTQRPVAVKQLHLSQMREWKTLEMFEREAKILQQLRHPRVPTYIDYCSLDTPEGKRFLLVQKYVEGKTLKQLIEEGWHGTEEEILEIFMDLVDILVVLHTLCPPVIHRDINPKNIIISSNHDVYPTVNDVYLVDFGAVQDRIRTTFLGGTTIVGTFGYVPFEQFSGQAVLASDYYALGATLLYMLTHRHPSDFPTEDLKPQIEPFFYGSPAIRRLLDGLLEPSVKKRIASPEQIKEVLDKHFSTLIELELSASSLQPETTKIDKQSMSHQHLVFRIPKHKIGFVVKRNILHLTPQWLYMNEELLGVSSGELWRIPTMAIHPSDLTWYFGSGKGKRKGRPVLGINHDGETFEISSHLNKVEIHWLTQEINEYIGSLEHQPQIVDQYSVITTERGEDVETQSQKKFAKPLDTHIKKNLGGSDQLRFRIPKTIHKKELLDLLVVLLSSLAFATLLTVAALFIIYTYRSIGWVPASMLLLLSIVFWGFGLGLLLTGISRFFGSIILHLSPEWIRISRRCWGIGYSQHIPTASIRPHDVIRYFHKNRLLLGISYAEKTLKIGAGLTLPESEWLIQEITNYIAQFAKLIPENVPEADLEMK